MVEVTAMLESHAGASWSGVNPEEDDRQALVTRVMARIYQKGKQLLDYRAPVLLAINLPPDRRPNRLPARPRRIPEQEVDLKRMAGTISLGLARCRHITAVLLSLWDVEPARDRSGLRLSNVTIIERPSSQRAYPRIRLLVLNPTADFPFQDASVEALKGLL